VLEQIADRAQAEGRRRSLRLGAAEVKRLS
jgi:hypothetical protein